MAFPGAYLTIIYAVLLHFTVVGTNSGLINFLDINVKTIVFSVEGLVFVSYPLLGLLADVKLTCYQMICLSCWMTFIAHFIFLLGNVVLTTEYILSPVYYFCLFLK